MKHGGERRMERGEGWLIAAALIVVLALSLGVYLAKRPEEALVAPLHAVPGDIFLLEKVNINLASAEELAELPGIGEVLAGRIVMYRQTNGAFEAAEDLLNVDGLGMGKLEAIRWHICIE